MTEKAAKRMRDFFVQELKNSRDYYEAYDLEKIGKDETFSDAEDLRQLEKDIEARINALNNYDFARFILWMGDIEWVF